MKSFSHSQSFPCFRGSIRVAILFLAASLSGGFSLASNTVKTVAPGSGASSSGSYEINTIFGGAYPVVDITWKAQGQSAIEPNQSGEHYPGQFDQQGYGFKVFDVNTNSIVGYCNLPLPGGGLYGEWLLFYTSSASGGVYWSLPVTNISYGDTLVITQHAITGVFQGTVNGRQTFYIVSESDDAATYTVPLKDPAVSEKGGDGKPNAKDPKRNVAEPVDAVTGAFSEDHVDLHLNGPLPIEVRRTYSSLNATTMNEFGYGWLFGYPSYLIPSDDRTTIQAADTDGSVIVFRQQ